MSDKPSAHISLSEYDRLHALYGNCRENGSVYDKHLNDIAARLGTLDLTPVQRKFCSDLLELGRQSGMRETAERLADGTNTSRRTEPLYKALQVALNEGLDKLPDPTFLARVHHCTNCDHFAADGQTLCEACLKKQRAPEPLKVPRL